MLDSWELCRSIKQYFLSIYNWKAARSPFISFFLFLLLRVSPSAVGSHGCSHVFTWEADVSNDELIPVPSPARARSSTFFCHHHHLHTIIATTNVILLICSYYHIWHSWMELPGSHYQLGIKHMNEYKFHGPDIHWPHVGIHYNQQGKFCQTNVEQECIAQW